MKLPLDLGVKLFFRLLLPGLLLACGAAPLLFSLMDAVGLGSHREVGFIIALIVLGWMIVAADMPIYMLLEGRRFWPEAVLQWRRRTEARRLQKVTAVIDEYYNSEQKDEDLTRKYSEASVERRWFPLNADGDRWAQYPTRLGNLIAAFETYSATRYGVDAIFYWPRIWVNLDRDLREEIDGQQALADSAVYSSTALVVAGSSWIVFAILAAVLPINATAEGGAFGFERLQDSILASIPDPPIALLVASILIALGIAVYQLAIYANGQFGVLFMAVIDAHVHRLGTQYMNVDAIADRVRKSTGQVLDENQFEVARRYLQYFNVKVPGRVRPVPAPTLVSAVPQPAPTRVTSAGETGSGNGG